VLRRPPSSWSQVRQITIDFHSPSSNPPRLAPAGAEQERRAGILRDAIAPLRDIEQGLEHKTTASFEATSRLAIRRNQTGHRLMEHRGASASSSTAITQSSRPATAPRNSADAADSSIGSASRTEGPRLLRQGLPTPNDSSVPASGPHSIAHDPPRLYITHTWSGNAGPLWLALRTRTRSSSMATSTRADPWTIEAISWPHRD
jgi:hypothetical protein